MKVEPIQVMHSGRKIKVPAINVGDTSIISSGRLVKIARIKGEDWEESDRGRDPALIIDCIKKSSLKADIFTFAQKLPETTPKYQYPFQWDNLAVIQLNSYDDWWKHKINPASRRNVRLATKRGVTTREAGFDDEFLKGVMDIYNETPIRQERRFWHYGKDLATVKRENSSYLDRSDFIGAYYGDELIGFVKIVHMGKVASIMQILSKNAHFHKRPSNALMAKVVERCAQKGVFYIIYCNYVYWGNTQSSLIEFKRRNGFEMMLVPRYYVPLTEWGRLALKLGLQHGIRGIIPLKLQHVLLNLRSRWYEKNAPVCTQT